MTKCFFFHGFLRFLRAVYISSFILGSFFFFRYGFIPAFPSFIL